MKIKLRCPSCSKLYEVDSSDIQSASPQFQCISCTSRFTFDYPPADPEHIHCTLLDAQSQSEFAELMKKQRSCPKCGALSPMESEECYSCHVIFARLEGLPEDNTLLRAQPSLVRKWKLLTEDFENEEKHDDFLRSCQELDALSFALSKYQDLKEAMGGDALCEHMIFRVQKLSEAALLSSAISAKAQKKEAKPIPWTSYMIAGIYFCSASMILWGSFSLGHRNLIGLGVAVACLTTGLILSIRGSVKI